MGCIVSVKGIEANPDKVRAIISLKSPTNWREVQKLTGRIATLNRFISKSVEKKLAFLNSTQRQFEP